MAFNWTFGRIASASSTAARCNYDLAAVTLTAKTVATPAPATKAFGMALNAADLSMLSMSMSTPPASFARTTMSSYAPRFPACHSHLGRAGHGPVDCIGRWFQARPTEAGVPGLLSCAVRRCQGAGPWFLTRRREA